MMSDVTNAVIEEISKWSYWSYLSL
jgi:hypothetical protein